MQETPPSLWHCPELGNCLDDFPSRCLPHDTSNPTHSFHEFHHLKNTALCHDLCLLSRLQVNSAPFSDGWMLKVKLTDPSQVDSLMDSAAYEKHCEESAH